MSGPYVNVAAACSDYVIGNDGTISLHRILDTIDIRGMQPGSSADVKDGRQLRCRYVLSLRSGNYQKASSVTVQLIGPDDFEEMVAKINAPFEALGELTAINLMWDVVQIVPGVGTYWFVATLGDPNGERELTRTPLVIDPDSTNIGNGNR